MGVQGLEQSVAVMRLGLKLAFNPRRCSLHFQLNAANPEHADIAKKLVDMAQKVTTPGIFTPCLVSVWVPRRIQDRTGLLISHRNHKGSPCRANRAFAN